MDSKLSSAARPSNSRRAPSRVARRLAQLGALGAVAYLGAACVAPTDAAPQAAESISYVSSQLAYYNSAQLWTANGGIVPVCWMPTTGDWSSEKQIIQNAIMRQWGRAANLSFLGWSDCPTTGSAKYIKINLQPTGLGNSWGTTVKPGGMGIMQDPTGSGSVSIGLSQDHTTSQTRIEYIGVHEFGHVLGFIHEQDRPDAPAVGSSNYCTNSIETVPVSYATSYDPSSVMNYCGPNNGVLSALDVAGVQKLYGRKPNGALVGDGGLCANVWGGAAVNGATIASYRCQGAKNDTWQMSAESGAVTFASGLPGCHMGLASNSEPLGAALVAEGCNWVALPGPDGFQMKNARLVGYGNLCLDTQGPYSQVVMRACNGSASQNWTYDGLHFLNGDTSQGQQCLDLNEGADVQGNSVLAWSCNGQTNQLWKIAAGGYISPQNSARVLDISHGGTTDGTPVAIWTMQGSPNQQWFIRTGLLSSSGLVADVAGPASTNEGRGYGLWTPNGGANQEFDFYP